MSVAACGVIHIHRGADKFGHDKPTKTEHARRFTVDRAITPLRVTLHDEWDGKGRGFDLPDRRNMAASFRRYLTRAGVDRTELHETTATSKAITFYDSRATGITWRAVRGDAPQLIQRAAGHTSFDTTNQYIREAENGSRGFGDVFPWLPEALLSEQSPR